MEVGFIELGKMGKPMARRLLAAGHTVYVQNRSPEPERELLKEGAKAPGSAAKVSDRAEVVLTALPTPVSVKEVYAELGAVARPGQLYIDHSTVNLALNRHCRLMARTSGCAARWARAKQ